MSTYFDKIIGKKKSVDKKPRHSKRLISLDDSDLVEDQRPNIFNQLQNQPQEKPTESPKKPAQRKEQLNVEIKAKPSKFQPLPPLPRKQTPSMVQLSPMKSKLPEIRRQPESLAQINNQQNAQQQDQDPQLHGVSRKTLLSLWQSINLDLGHFFYSYSFPIRRQIPIIANNLDMERQKYENGTYISQSFDNNLQISFLLFFLRAILIENFLRFSSTLWIIAIILSFVIDSNQQYQPGKGIILGIFLFFVVVSIFLQYMSVKGRRNWTQPASDIKYKVYRFDNELRTGQWISTAVSDLRPGNIYKIPKSSLTNISIVPADSILLHGPRTIMQLDQSPVIEYLSPMQKQQRITLKQTLIKSQQIALPLTGVIHYELSAPEIMPENIYGRFLLQEPKEQTYYLTYSNILLRGTRIVPAESLLTEQINKDAELYTKQQQILAVVLETGIDSLVLKTCQYPFQIRKQYPYVFTIDMILLVCSVVYLIVVGAGILIGYINMSNKSIARAYYIDDYINLGAQVVSLPKIVLHHFGNFIMIVPIMLRVAYLLYVNIIGRVMSSKLHIKVKDMNMISDLVGVDVLVTTIGADLIKMGNANNQNENVQGQEQQNKILSVEQSRQLIQNRSLQSIRVGSILHNFLTTSIDNVQYTPEDVDMICYFMSIALLTCNRRNPTPLQRAIIERCNKQLNVRIEKLDDAYGVLKIGQLRVVRIFTLPATQKYPYKIVFYRHGKDIIQDIEHQQHQQSAEEINVREREKQNEKVLCLIRGQTAKITTKIRDSDGYALREFSSKNHQEKGYHIELLGKFVLTYEEFVDMKRLYMNVDQWQNQRPKVNNNPNSSLSGKDDSKMKTGGLQRYDISKFYEVLDRYIQKIDPMGLLIWQNPYSILSSTLSPISSLPQITYKIIIVPPSKSQTNPQFQSIHAITNYLLKTSKLSLKEISNKILHSYSSKQTFWSLLRNQKILVLNGWDYRIVKKMLVELKEMKLKNKESNRNRSRVKILGYIEQDEYAWILKQTDISISTKGDGYDLEKYSDFLINSSTSSSTTTSIIGKLFICAEMYSYCLNSIIIVQFMKGLMLATIEFINCFYTWGTGLVLIGSPLYLLLEVGVLLDVLYFLFAKPNNLTNNYALNNLISNLLKENDRKPILKNKDKQQLSVPSLPYDSHLSIQSWIFEFFFSIAVGIFITFIPIYSMTEPPTPSGTVEPKQFTNVLIHFILYHVLIFRKVLINTYSISVYKFFILAVQIGIYYIGLLIISAFDPYLYKGIIWYVIKGKIVLVAVFMVWMVMGLYWLKFMLVEGVFKKKRPTLDMYERILPSSRVKNDEQQKIQERRIGQVVDIE